MNMRSVTTNHQLELPAPPKTGSIPHHSSYVTAIYKTKDYAIFKPLSDNRPINLVHIRRLVESFKVHYLISPLIVNEKFEVIDGQHRLEACKETGVPVYYFIMPGYSTPEVTILNSNQKNWTKMDFLAMYVAEGYEAYVQFDRFMKDFPEIDFSGCEQLVRLAIGGHKDNKIAAGKSPLSKDFQEGRLKIPNLEKSYTWAKKIMDFKPYYPGFRKRGFVAAIMGLLTSKLYNHKEMLYKCEIAPESLRLKDTNTVEDYRMQLESVYNWKRAKENKVSFKYLH
jgi:ParB/Sulfiredoxin domain